DVDLRQPPADEIWSAPEAALERIEHGEHGLEGLLVGFPSGGEAGAIDAVVERRVYRLVERVDLGSQVRGVEVDPIVGERTEARIEDPEEIGRLVVDDGLPLLVPQRQHGGAAGEMRIGAGVDL